MFWLLYTVAPGFNRALFLFQLFAVYNVPGVPNHGKPPQKRKTRRSIFHLKAGLNLYVFKRIHEK
jgi:hypothetical protein